MYVYIYIYILVLCWPVSPHTLRGCLAQNVQWTST